MKEAYRERALVDSAQNCAAGGGSLPPYGVRRAARRSPGAEASGARGHVSSLAVEGGQAGASPPSAGLHVPGRPDSGAACKRASVTMSMSGSCDSYTSHDTCAQVYTSVPTNCNTDYMGHTRVARYTRVRV